MVVVVFFFQAEDGIRDLVRSRGLGDVYKRQEYSALFNFSGLHNGSRSRPVVTVTCIKPHDLPSVCLLYTSDAADERSSVDLGGRRIIKKKNKAKASMAQISTDRYRE